MTKKRTKSHTPYNKMLDGIRGAAQAAAEIGHHPQEWTVGEEPPPWPFKDGRVNEQDLKGAEHPDVMDLAKSTKGKVKPLGAEGGTIAGKKGDKLNPNGDQEEDDENGSVHPDQHVKGAAWFTVVTNNLDKRKRSERQDESLDEDERRQIIEEVQELLASKEPSVIAEEVVEMVEMIESLQGEIDYIKKERDDLMDETLRQQLLIHIQDFTRCLTLAQADKFLRRAVDVVDMTRMSTDAQYLQKTFGRLKEEVVRESRQPVRASSLTEGFADLEAHDERVAPFSDKGVASVINAMKIFRVREQSKK